MLLSKFMLTYMLKIPTNHDKITTCLHNMPLSKYNFMNLWLKKVILDNKNTHDMFKFKAKTTLINVLDE